MGPLIFYGVFGAVFVGTSGYACFVFHHLEKALENDYKLNRESITGQMKDISLIEAPIVYKLANPSFSLERFSKTKFYNQIKEFSDVLENNFSKEYLQNYYLNMKEIKINNRTLIDFITRSMKHTEGMYDPYKNQIVLKNDSSIYHELFHLASTNPEGYVGFHQKGMGRALNEGYTEFLTKRYFPEKESLAYSSQVTIAEQVERLIGKDKMEKLYLTSDFKGLINELSEYASKEVIQEFITLTDHILDVFLKHLDTSLEKPDEFQKMWQDMKKANQEEKRVEEILLTMFENKMIIDAKENNLPEYKLDDVHLLLKLRNMPNTDLNNSMLNKDLSKNLRHRITDMPELSSIKIGFADYVMAVIDEEEVFNGYLEDGFQGVIAEMNKYLSIDEVEKVINSYELLQNRDIQKTPEEFQAADKELKKITVFYNIRKIRDNFEANELVGYWLSNIIGAYITLFSTQRFDVSKGEFVNTLTDEVLERLLSEIYDEFAGNSIIEEAIDRVRQRYYENKEDLDNFYNHDYSKENLDKSVKKMFIKQKTSLI